MGEATNPGTPVWSHAGIICTGETYKNVVKMTFAKGASLPDPSGLFNSSLEGNTRRAIDFHEGDKIDEKALKALIRAAVALNTSSAARRAGDESVDGREGIRGGVGMGSKIPARGSGHGSSGRPCEREGRRSASRPPRNKLDEAQLAGWVKQASQLPGWGKA